MVRTGIINQAHGDTYPHCGVLYTKNSFLLTYLPFFHAQILSRPVKPKMFPYSAVPTSRPRAAEIMSRSLNPNLDNVSFTVSSRSAGSVVHKSVV